MHSIKNDYTYQNHVGYLMDFYNPLNYQPLLSYIEEGIATLGFDLNEKKTFILHIKC